MSTRVAWDKARFAVERRCTCRPGDRSAECAQGWHRVDGYSTEAAALRAAKKDDFGGAESRVVDTEVSPHQVIS